MVFVRILHSRIWQYRSKLDQNILDPPHRSIVVRMSVLAGELSLSCARPMDGRLTTLWVKRLLSVNQQGQLSLNK